MNAMADMPDVCGGTWLAASASFLAMWMAMMVPMMLPSLAPALWRWRQGIAVAAGAGYFFVWALLGLAVQPLALLFARTGTPLVAGAVVLGAGLVQLGAWKRRQLAGCRACMDACFSSPPAAWLHGMHLGVRCALSCGNLMAVVLVAGMMDPWIMAAVTAAITLERVARRGAAVAQATGVVVTGAGLLLVARALGA